jgi:hypothetical protein
MKKKPVNNPALRSWLALNDALREAGESVCEALLEEELKGRKRKQFIKRIHSRLNKVRADRERAELEAKMS